MLTSSQRAALRSLAQKEEPVTQVGKSGVCEGLIDSLDAALEKRELIKVTVLENSGLSPKEAGEEIAAALSAEQQQRHMSPYGTNATVRSTPGESDLNSVARTKSSPS